MGVNRVLIGAIAGAAGTMALDLTTYGDMAARGRGSSDLPAEVVRRLAAKAGLEPLGKPNEESDSATKNRRSALGAMSGYVIGLLIGFLYGAAHKAHKDVPFGIKALLIGGLAMAASDVPATLLEATDPRKWDTSGWLADIAPHVTYGVVTAYVFEALSG